VSEREQKSRIFDRKGVAINTSGIFWSVVYGNGQRSVIVKANAREINKKCEES
jgi:ribosomal protein L25 (general stress protein Ctc)